MIKDARAAQDDMNRLNSMIIDVVEQRRDPLDDASYSIQQAVADLYIQIRNANDHATIMTIWERLGELESLISACGATAGRKADAI